MAAQTNLQKDVLIMYLEDQLNEIARNLYSKPIEELTDLETYYVVLTVVKRILSVSDRIEGEKKVYYVSMEFLIGKLLSNNLINIGIYDRMKEILASKGKELAVLEEIEPEPSLGNGGLGRLAACFLDSISTLGLSGDGVGLLYHFGLFKQVFVEGRQTAEKNDWIENISWLNKSDISYDIYFGKDKVTSRLYNIDVIGYEQGVNRLRLFDIESIDEAL
ncbi:MAG: glycogen/starch/alpha-glucan phosphorylase, partial [Lachnospiraceae bacterium]|nr:glycogen/starch/alpha-glucan phosphorylase [Lachnospiraceae bacterium]